MTIQTPRSEFDSVCVCGGEGWVGGCEFCVCSHKPGRLWKWGEPLCSQYSSVVSHIQLGISVWSESWSALGWLQRDCVVGALSSLKRIA